MAVRRNLLCWLFLGTSPGPWLALLGKGVQRDVQQHSMNTRIGPGWPYHRAFVLESSQREQHSTSMQIDKQQPVCITSKSTHWLEDSSVWLGSLVQDRHETIRMMMMAWRSRNKKNTVLFVITMKPLPINWPIRGSIALNRRETPAGETHKCRLFFSILQTGSRENGAGITRECTQSPPRPPLSLSRKSVVYGNTFKLSRSVHL